MPRQKGSIGASLPTVLISMAPSLNLNLGNLGIDIKIERSLNLIYSSSRSKYKICIVCSPRAVENELVNARNSQDHILSSQTKLSRSGNGWSMRPGNRFTHN